MSTLLAAYEQADNEPEGVLAADWEPVDLAELAKLVRSPDYEPLTPTILTVEGDGKGLFYPGLLNQLFGEPGSGKTWIARAAALEVAHGGGRVLWVDYEDAARGMVEGLVSLGASDADFALIDYRHPDSGILRGLEWFQAQEDVAYELVVIDSTGESMAAGGLKLTDAEVAVWFQRVKRLGTACGEPAILVLDHVAKNPNSAELYPTESQRKLAAVSGASYRADIVVRFAKGTDGKVKVRVAKDRPGSRPKGVTAAMVDFTSGPDGMLTVKLGRSDGAAASEAGGRWMPTVLMERVSRWLEMHPGSTLGEIKREVSGRGEHVATAAGELAMGGWARVDYGPRNSQRYTMSTPYREGEAAPSSTPVASSNGHGMTTETLTLGTEEVF